MNTCHPQYASSSCRWWPTPWKWARCALLLCCTSPPPTQPPPQKPAIPPRLPPRCFMPPPSLDSESHRDGAPPCRAARRNYLHGTVRGTVRGPALGADRETYPSLLRGDENRRVQGLRAEPEPPTSPLPRSPPSGASRGGQVRGRDDGEGRARARTHRRQTKVHSCGGHGAGHGGGCETFPSILCSEEDHVSQAHELPRPVDHRLPLPPFHCESLRHSSAHVHVHVRACRRQGDRDGQR